MGDGVQKSHLMSHFVMSVKWECRVGVNSKDHVPLYNGLGMGGVNCGFGKIQCCDIYESMNSFFW